MQPDESPPVLTLEMAHTAANVRAKNFKILSCNR